MGRQTSRGQAGRLYCWTSPRLRSGACRRRCTAKPGHSDRETGPEVTEIARISSTLKPYKKNEGEHGGSLRLQG